MSIPTKEEISRAIEIRDSLSISELDGYNPIPGILGPESFSGGFCIVFPFQKGGIKKAVRIWHQEINDIKERYQVLADDILKSRSPYLCNVSYHDKALNVNGEQIDVVLMDWIEGKSLKSYIQDILDNNQGDNKKKKSLKKLNNGLLAMFESFHSLHFSHGDLQHDNILVDENGGIKVIDYDCFYTPTMGSGFKQTTSGYKGYQHPKRSTQILPSNEKVDYFSELVLYLSILALSEDLSLWNVAKDADFSFLFSENDFKDFRNAPICKRVSTLGDECKELLGILDEYLNHNDINELRPFTDYLLCNKISFSTTALKAKRNTQQVTVKWDVPFKAKVKLKHDGELIPQDFNVRGQYSTTLKESSDFCLIAETEEGQLIEKKIRIDVFDECAIEFKSDKSFIFPSVPVTLSWDVTNAKRVTLDSKPVKHTGFLVVEPNKDTTYVLKAKDEFGTKERKIEIKMLPIPQIRTLLVPTPRIDANLNISINRPQFTPINLPFIQAPFSPIKVIQPSLKRDRHKIEKAVFQNVRMNLSRLSSLIKQRINKKEQYGKDN